MVFLKRLSNEIWPRIRPGRYIANLDAKRRQPVPGKPVVCPFLRKHIRSQPVFLAIHDIYSRFNDYPDRKRMFNIDYRHISGELDLIFSPFFLTTISITIVASGSANDDAPPIAPVDR